LKNRVKSSKIELRFREVRPQGCTLRTSVQQALILAYRLFKAPKSYGFGAFSFLKFHVWRMIPGIQKRSGIKQPPPLKSGLAFGKITAMELPADGLAVAHTVRIDQAVQIFYAPMSHRSANPYAQMSPLSSADSFATISAVSLSLSVTSSLVPYASTYPVPSTNWRGCIIIASGCMYM
jgi:hypothetical protein